MATNNSIVDQVSTLARGLLVLFVATVVVGAIFAAALPLVGSAGDEAINTVGQTGQFLDVPDMTYSSGVTVSATNEQALSFDGAGGVAGGIPGNLTRNGSAWSVCTVATLSGSAQQNSTYTVAAYQNGSVSLHYDVGDWLLYYDNGSANATVEIDAPSPTDRTAVCGRYNGSEIRVFRDGTASTSASLTASTPRKNASLDWEGTLDEVRWFNSSLSNATISDYASDPIQPLPGTNRSVRYLFDEGEGDSTYGYFAGQSASITGGTWVPGVEGPGMTQGTDYEIREDPFQIKLLSSGYMDGAPVVFVESSGGVWYSVLVTIGNFGAVGLTLLGLTMIILGGSYAFSRFDGFGGGGGR